MMSENTRARAHAHVDSLPFEDLAAKQRLVLDREEIEPSQICRTCIFVSQRLHGHTPSEVIAHRKAGGSANDLHCQPGTHTEIKNLFSDGSRRTAVVSPGPVKVSISKKPGTLVGRVITCGQTLQTKCMNCQHLVPLTISVTGGFNSSGKEWKKTITAGGYCNIGPDGVVVNGKRVTCERKSIVREINEGSCFTCGNAQVFSNNWVSDYPSVVRADLTTYEMEKARKGANPDEVGLAIWGARMNVGTTYWPITPTSKQRSKADMGLIRFIETEVVKIHRAPLLRQVKPARYAYTERFALVPNNGDGDWMTWGRFIFATREEFQAQWDTEKHHTNTEVKSWFERELKIVSPPVFEEVDTRVIGWTVRIKGSGNIAYFEADCSDDKVGIVHRTPNPGRVIIQIQEPWHRLYGMMDLGRVAYRKYPTTECTTCAGAGKLTDPEEDCWVCHGIGTVADTTYEVRHQPRVYEPDFDCIVSTEGGCTASHACYAHGKGLEMVESEEGVDYEFEWPMGRAMARIKGDGAGERRKKVRALFKEYDASARMSDNLRRLHFDPEVNKILNGDDNEPDPWIFRLQLRGLLERFSRQPHIRAAILSQSAALERPMAFGKARSISRGLGSFMGVEPGKPYCTLNMFNPNMGLNLREVFGDWFGDMRAVRVTNPLYARTAPMSPADPYFSWQQAMELEDWQRVTNPGERIAEEIVRNEHQLQSARAGMPGFDKAGRRLEPWQMPANPIVSQLMVGNVAETTAEYVQWLDDEVEVPISEDGQTMRVSHRWLTHGYEIKGRTGANKKRKTTGAQADVEVVRFDHNADPADPSEDGRMVGFLCTAPSCGQVYTPDEINDPVNPTCTHVVFFNEETDEVRLCGAPLRWDEQDREWEQGHTRTHGPANPDEPYRRVGSPTMATGPNSRRWQSDERMLRVGCNSWRPKPWVRSYQKVASASKAKAREQINAADWLGKQIKLRIDGVEETFIIGVDISLESPVMEAVTHATDNSAMRVTGGHGNRVTVQVISISE